MDDALKETSNGVREKKSGWGQKRFWHWLVSIVTAMIVLAIILNFIVNPFKLYYFNFFPPAEVNVRELKGDLIRKAAPPPQVLIIGSSRVMSFDPEYVTRLTGKPCFNYGGPAAMAEDYYATIRYVREDCGAPIDTVIVGIDLEAFHPTLPTQAQGRFLPDYAKYYTQSKDPDELLIKRLTMLLSMEQTGESIAVLQRALKKEAGRPNIEYVNNGMAIMASREADIKKGTFNLEQRIALRVRRYPERSLGLASYKDLSETRKGYWEKFLRYCSDNGIIVYAFLTPYHPEVLQVIELQGGEKIIEKVRGYLKDTTSAPHVIFRDYLKVENFGGDVEMFYDEIHMRPENCNALLKNLLSESQKE